jgi:putative transposase
MITKHPARLVSFDYRGEHAYSLTWCCHNRQRLFVQRDKVDFVRAQILRACEPTGIEIPAYCYMPDHVHILANGADENADAKRFISLARQYSGFEFTNRYRHRLWQRYSYERVLRKQETSQSVARYILENPVRAKLVAAVQDYPFAGSETMERKAVIEWAYGPCERSG